MELKLIRADDSVTHVSIIGRLDLEGVNQIQDRFVITTTARRKSTLVDLSAVPFIASLGMGMLVAAAKALQRQGKKLILVRPPELVQRALEAAGINQVIPIVATEQAGLDLFT